MAQLNEIFDADSVEPAVPLEALPPGKYLAHIIDSDMRSTKDGSGSFLWLAIEILDGPYTGRQTWDRLNLENPNRRRSRSPSGPSQPCVGRSAFGRSAIARSCTTGRSSSR